MRLYVLLPGLLFAQAIFSQTLLQTFEYSPAINDGCWSSYNAQNSAAVFINNAVSNVYQGNYSLGLAACCVTPGPVQPAFYVSPELPGGEHPLSFMVKQSSFAAGEVLEIGILSGLNGENWKAVQTISGWSNPAVWMPVHGTIETNTLQNRIAFRIGAGAAKTYFLDNISIGNVGAIGGVCNTVLPYSQFLLEARMTREALQLDWALDVIATSFDIQFSDGQQAYRHWVSLPVVLGISNYTHMIGAAELPEAPMLWVRLSARLQDGSIVYSPAVQVQMPGQKPALRVHRSKDAVWARYDSQIRVPLYWQLLDPQGRVCATDDSGESSWMLPLEGRPAGLYVLTLHSLGRFWQQKIAWIPAR